MRSDEIDLGFYCSHAAVHLVEEDDRFMIYAPVILNGEVLVLAEDVGQVNEMENIGISNGREHLKKLIKEQYQLAGQMVELSPGALNYSLEDKQIQAAVMDIAKASLMEGYQYLPVTGGDYISYVLVVRQDKVDTAAFTDFIQTYNKVAAEIRDTGLLFKDEGIGPQVIEAAGVKVLAIQ